VIATKLAAINVSNHAECAGRSNRARRVGAPARIRKSSPFRAFGGVRPVGGFSYFSDSSLTLDLHTAHMVRAERQEPARRARAAAQQNRDAALRRIGRARVWLIAAAGALTAAIAGLVSAVAPGKTLGAKRGIPAIPVASTGGSAASSTALPPLATPAQLGLQGPGEAPQAAPTPQIDPSQVAPPAQPDPTQVAPSAGYSGGGAVVSGGS